MLRSLFAIFALTLTLNASAHHGRGADNGTSIPVATLSSPTPSGTLGTTTTATVGATTTISTGTFYCVVDTATNLSGETVAEVKAAHNTFGSAALASNNSTVSGTSPTCGVTGLVSGFSYSYAAVQHSAGGDSNLVTGTFVTGGVASLSSPTPSGTLGTSTTATLGATTNQISGTFYTVVDSSGNLSGVTVTQIKAGQKASGSAALASNNATISTTTPSVSVSGLTSGTTYSYASVQSNTNGNSNVVTGTFTTATSGGATNWTQVTIPTQVNTIYQSDIYAASDGYLYLSTNNGMWRALASSLNTNPTGTTWTNLSSTTPPCPGSVSNNGCPSGYLSASAWSVDTSGDIIAGFGHNGLSTCSYCVVAIFSHTALTWSTGVVVNSNLQGHISSIAPDGNGVIWASGTWDGLIFKTTNTNVSWTQVSSGNAYTQFGQSAGSIYYMQVINGTLFWGGEGGLMATSITNFATTSLVEGGSGYSTNFYRITSDGDIATAPTEIISYGREDSSGYPIQRYNGSSWSDVTSSITQYWLPASEGALANDTTAHTYYIVGKTSSVGGVLKSSDGGQTWTDYTGTLSTCSSAPPCDPQGITISSANDVKFVLMGDYTVWVHN
jgi:hypothetical protein